MGLVKNILYSLSNKKMIDVFKNQSIFPYYHVVSNDNLEHINHLFEFKNIDQFKSDVNILLKNYKPLSPKFFLESPNLDNIPKNHFLLTFDDGLSEVYNIIAPILYEKKISALFFINPDYIDSKNYFLRHGISIIIGALLKFEKDEKTLKKINSLLEIYEKSSINLTISSIKKIDNSKKDILNEISSLLSLNLKEYLHYKKPFLSKDQIKKMIKMGFYFGGHTMSHPMLNSIDFKLQKKEVINSIKWLKSNFDINYSFFSFPFSDKGISKKLINAIFEYDNSTIIFGNSGIKKDFSKRIIQRFSLEKRNHNTEKLIISENLYKFYNILIGKFNIKRN